MRLAADGSERNPQAGSINEQNLPAPWLLRASPPLRCSLPCGGASRAEPGRGARSLRAPSLGAGTRAGPAAKPGPGLGAQPAAPSLREVLGAPAGLITKQQLRRDISAFLTWIPSARPYGIQSREHICKPSLSRDYSHGGFILHTARFHTPTAVFTSSLSIRGKAPAPKPARKSLHSSWLCYFQPLCPREHVILFPLSPLSV